MRVTRAEQKLGALETNAAEVVGELGGVGLDLRGRIFVTNATVEQKGPRGRIVARAVGTREFIALPDQDPAGHCCGRVFTELRLEATDFQRDGLRIRVDSIE